MLWVLKRTISMRQFFWAPTTYAQKFCLFITGPMERITLYAQKPPAIQTYTAGLNFGIGLHLHPYFVYAGKSGFGESAYMSSLLDNAIHTKFLCSGPNVLNRYLQPFWVFSFSSFNPYKPSVLFKGHRQIVQTQIRRRVLRRLIWVSTVCLQNVLLEFEWKWKIPSNIPQNKNGLFQLV